MAPCRARIALTYVTWCAGAQALRVAPRPPAGAPAAQLLAHPGSLASSAARALAHAVAAAAVCAALAAPPPASARVLTEGEVAAKLASVPVFAVTSKSGKPFFFDAPDGGGREGRFFLEYTAAQEQVRKIPSRLLRPADTTIRSLPLDQVYFGFVARAFSIDDDAGSGTQFRLLPSGAAVADARRLIGNEPELAARLPEKNALNGAVPLFVEPSLQLKGADGAERTPVFFDDDDLLATFRRAAVDTSAKPQIRVTDLATLVARMQSDASLDSETLVLVPSSSALAVAEASMRAQAEEDARAQASSQPLAPARTLTDEQVMALPFAGGQ
ncbi:hypothetical protein KFE25_002032 [Diacronema lutheri]|uniref:Uncharacterized protein n=1 Tax=Diacronema lutheri TaxID=2081491 RepID=A0A8J5XL64_DIALT|nr:hypothetical protein KFE25_002032 [Diacronema lutheri]